MGVQIRIEELSEKRTVPKHFFYPYLNPHYSFLRVPKHRYTNTGLNGAKIRIEELSEKWGFASPRRICLRADLVS